MPSWVDPAVAFCAIQAEFPQVAWLDSGPNAQKGVSYIAGTNSKPQTFSGDSKENVYEWLKDQLNTYSPVDTSACGVGGFHLGWMGWFGYELGAATCKVPYTSSEYPDAAFLFAQWALEFDHQTSQLSFLCLGDETYVSEQQLFLKKLLEQVELEQGPVGNPTEVRWRHSSTEYTALVSKCLDAIAAGDAYQLCLTNTVEISGKFNPVAVYLELRQANPTHHGGFIRLGDISLLSSSPEVFLNVNQHGRIQTKPIKGTRPRGADKNIDAELAHELVSSEKERAENLMIVDLMRNDVGKVSALGTVQVESLLEVESYESVHQLVSTVTGQLDQGLSPIDVIVSCFPAGSMTGAPKISAMRILHELEQGPRGIYSGAFGYIGLDGSIDLAMVIRSIVISDSKASIGTGGGITSGSVPQAELEETFIKVAPLLRALGAS